MKLLRTRPELTEVDRQKMLMTTKLTIAKMDENDEHVDEQLDEWDL